MTLRYSHLLYGRQAKTPALLDQSAQDSPRAAEGLKAVTGDRESR